jgi:Sulfotransferase domain
MHRLPNAVFIGVPKTGSTWLHRMLEAHPDCFTVPCKGLDFFDKNWTRGTDWYAARFSDCRTESIVIDISHDYAYDIAAPHRIEQLLPAARMLAFLRDPVDRLESAVQFALRSGFSLSTLEDVAQTPLVMHSRYGSTLRHWEGALSSGALRVFFYEELRASPEKFWAAVADYLDLDPVPVSNLAEVRHLPATSARFPRATRQLRRTAHRLRHVSSGRPVERVKRSKAVNSVFFKHTTPDKYFRFSDAEHESLIELLRTDVHELDAILGGEVRHRWPTYWT